jgi:hypothetical protein
MAFPMRLLANPGFRITGPDSKLNKEIDATFFSANKFFFFAMLPIN